MSRRSDGHSALHGVAADTTQQLSARSYRHHVASIARGSGFLAGGSLIEFVLRFFIGVLLARLLGSADYGMYSLAISATTLFAAISLLGLDDAMTRYVAILSGRADRAGVRGTIQIGLGVTMPVAAAMGVVLFFTAPLVAEGLFDEPLLTPALRLMSIAVPCLALSNVLLGITRGFGRMDHAAFSESIVQSTVRLALLAALSLTGLSLQGALVVFIVSDLTSSVVLGVLLNRGFRLRPSAHDETRRDTRAIFRFAVPLWMSGLLNKFQTNISLFILGSTSAVSNVGLFAIVSQVNLVGQAVYRAVIVAVKPLLAQLNDRGDRSGLTHIYTTTTRWLLMTNIPFFLAMALYPRSILAIYGESFTAAASALTVMSLAQLVAAGTGICGSLLDMTGHTTVKLFNSVLWLVLAIATNAVLVPRFGVIGAACAHLICISIVNAARMSEIWILERVLPSWRAYLKPGLAGAIALGFGFGLRTVWPVGSAIGPAVLQGLVVGALYVAIIALAGLDEDDQDIFSNAVAKLTGRLARLRRRA